MTLTDKACLFEEDLEDLRVLLEALDCLHRFCTSLKGLVEEEISCIFVLLKFKRLLHLTEVPENPLNSPELAIVIHLKKGTQVLDTHTHR